MNACCMRKATKVNMYVQCFSLFFQTQEDLLNFDWIHVIFTCVLHGVAGAQHLFVMFTTKLILNCCPQILYQLICIGQV